MKIKFPWSQSGWFALAYRVSSDSFCEEGLCRKVLSGCCSSSLDRANKPLSSSEQRPEHNDDDDDDRLNSQTKPVSVDERHFHRRVIQAWRGSPYALTQNAVPYLRSKSKRLREGPPTTQLSSVEDSADGVDGVG